MVDLVHVAAERLVEQALVPQVVLLRRVTSRPGGERGRGKPQESEPENLAERGA